MASDDSLLDRLRDLEFTQSTRPRMSFSEWYSETEAMRKAGGRSIALYAPGAGMMGPGPGYTSSYAPTGPYNRPSGNPAVGLKQTPQQFGVPSGVAPSPAPSQYAFQRPDQPPPWIADVDMASIWYSPMQPVWPFGPPYYTTPREWNYPVGYNLNYVPARMELNQMLRGMRRSWGVLSTVETTRMDQLMRLPWTIQRRDKPKAVNRSVDQMRQFFRRPDGKLTYGQWSRKILFDVFDLDFPVLYINRHPVDGAPKFIEVLDGGTIFPLIDDAGRRPDTLWDVDPDSGITYIRRQPAFQQIIYGLPMINLSEDEIINPVMRPQPDQPMFGYSPIEQCLSEITEAIRKTFYQLEFWRSGSMPELIVTVPDNWNPRQIATFQAHFDALLSGQLTLKSKVRFVPGGMKPFDIKNASGESLWSQRDELLVRLICYAFSVSPTPFVRQMNRATAQNAQQSAQEEGLYPLMSYWKDDIMDYIIQDIHGMDDVEFVFLPRPEVDLEKQAKIHQVQVDEGLRSRNEVRAELGEEPIDGGDIYTVKTNSGVVPLDMVVSGEAAQIMPGAGSGKVPGGTQPAKAPEPGQGSPMRGPPRPANASTAPKPSVRKGAEDGQGAALSALLQDSPWGQALLKSLHAEIHQEAKRAEKPSKGQKDAGNYKKGHIRLYGLDISIETPRGEERHGHSMDDEKWSSTMAGDYGYIRGTLGHDGDQIDVCIGRHPKSTTVYVLDQFRTNTDSFDEHKVFLGYRSAKGALKAYLKSNGDELGALRAGHLTEMSIAEFKQWLRRGNHRVPAAGQGFGDLVKYDTVSSATGLGNQPVFGRPSRRKRKRSRAGPRWLELRA